MVEIPARTLRDPEIDLAIEREKLRADIKSSAHTKRDLVKYHLLNGASAQYVSMRYGIPLEHIEKAQKVWGIEPIVVDREKYKPRRYSRSSVSNAEGQESEG